jgi:cytidine deaminase
MKVDYKLLVAAAIKARENSYSPYSNFKVGAAVLTKEGNIYAGVNVENASYGLTICAERSALCAAVSGGERAIAAVAVVYDTRMCAVPCGACLQFIVEFGSGIDIVMATTRGKYTVKKVSALLPVLFHCKDKQRK